MWSFAGHMVCGKERSLEAVGGFPHESELYQAGEELQPVLGGVACPPFPNLGTYIELAKQKGRERGGLCLALVGFPTPSASFSAPTGCSQSA